MRTAPIDPALEVSAGRVVARVRLRAQLRTAWLQALGREDSDLLTSLGRDTVHEEARWQSSDESARALGEALAAIETTMAAVVSASSVA